MTDIVHPLDNPVWTALTTALSNFAVGHGAARSFRREVATEISAMCTHPEARRRGLAGALTAAVARGIVAAGSIPILHVAETNDGARRIYRSLGFRTRSMITFAAVHPPVTSVT